MSAAAITLAHIGRAMAKTIIVRDGRIVDTMPAPNARLHHFRDVELGGLDDLLGAVEEAAGRGEIALRGQLLASVGRRAIYDDPEKGPAGLEVVPRLWVAFDWDNLPLAVILDPIPGIACELLQDIWPDYRPWLPVDPLRDPETITRHALRRLPPAFRDVSCIWQFSASAGYKPGGRLRTWHWLDHPCTGAELKLWCKPAIDRELVDPATLVEAQPCYLAVRAVGEPDPCPRRFGLFRQARDVVPVPDLAGMKGRAEQKEREARLQQQLQRPARTTPGSYGPAEDRIADCGAKIRAASPGNRTPTFNAEAARAKAICDKYRIPWHPVRTDLLAAFASTLSSAERGRLDKNGEAMLAWLEARAAA